MSVVVVMIMVGVSATLLLLIMSWNTTTSRLIERQGTQAAWYATACAERTLAAIGLDPSERATESFAFGNDGCTALPVSPVTSVSFLVRAEGTSGLSFGRLVVSVSMSVNASGDPSLTVLSRDRVAGF